MAGAAFDDLGQAGNRCVGKTAEVVAYVPLEVFPEDQIAVGWIIQQVFELRHRDVHDQRAVGCQGLCCVADNVSHRVVRCCVRHRVSEQTEALSFQTRAGEFLGVAIRNLAHRLRGLWIPGIETDTYIQDKSEILDASGKGAANILRVGKRHNPEPACQPLCPPQANQIVV